MVVVVVVVRGGYEVTVGLRGMREIERGVSQGEKDRGERGSECN